jgi:hypothetical protein
VDKNLLTLLKEFLRRNPTVNPLPVADSKVRVNFLNLSLWTNSTG